LVDEIEASVIISDALEIRWINEVSNSFLVNADKEQMYRVLMNMCRNAVEAQGDGGVVCISSEQKQGLSIIRIKDEGPGIPPRAKEHLFEPFAGSVKSGGTGLGLSIARELVVAHGGIIQVEQSDENGTCFAIQLPN